MDSLCYELLENIFNFCQKSDYKNLLFVNKLFRNTVLNIIGLNIKLFDYKTIRLFVLFQKSYYLD